MYPIFSFETVDSTNRIGWELALQGVAHGSAVKADRQTSGRGRLDRSWHSPAQKGLYCSIVIRPQVLAREYPKITLVAGLSVATALDKICGCKISLKWPNDIFLGGRKLGGILTEAFPIANDKGAAFAVVGIGVNINSRKEDFPLELVDRVTSVFLEIGREHNIHDVFKEIRKVFLGDISRFEHGQFPEILAEWQRRDMLNGKMVTWMKQSGEVICGRCLGPDSDGLLSIMDDLGNYQMVISGDVLLHVEETGF